MNSICMDCGEEFPVDVEARNPLHRLAYHVDRTHRTDGVADA